jgi:hypothetical protein
MSFVPEGRLKTDYLEVLTMASHKELTPAVQLDSLL